MKKKYVFEEKCVFWFISRIREKCVCAEKCVCEGQCVFCLISRMKEKYVLEGECVFWFISRMREKCVCEEKCVFWFMSHMQEKCVFERKMCIRTRHMYLNEKCILERCDSKCSWKILHCTCSGLYVNVTQTYTYSLVWLAAKMCRRAKRERERTTARTWERETHEIL